MVATVFNDHSSSYYDHQTYDYNCSKVSRNSSKAARNSSKAARNSSKAARNSSKATRNSSKVSRISSGSCTNVKRICNGSSCSKVTRMVLLLLITLAFHVDQFQGCLSDLYCNHPDLICKEGMCVSKHKREFHEVSVGDMCNDDSECYSENIAMECHYAYYGYKYYYSGKCRYKCRRGQRLIPNLQVCECKWRDDCYWYESCNENYGCGIAWWVYVLLALSGIGLVVISTFTTVFILRKCCNRNVVETRTVRRRKRSKHGAVYTRAPIERHVSWSKPTTRTIYP